MTHHDPRPVEPRLPRERPRIPALVYFLTFGVLYLIAVLTPFGQGAENSLLGGELALEAWIYPWSGSALDGSALPPQDQTAMPTLIVGLIAISALTLVRRCWWQGVAAIGVVGGTLVANELFGELPRPDLVQALENTEPSFPSGHAAVPAVLALGVSLVASARFRPYVIAVGLPWLAITAGAVQSTYQHRPSDVLGATLLACAVYTLAVRLLPPITPSSDTWRSPAWLTVVITLSVAAAVVGSARNDSLTESIAFATSSLLCVLLLWTATAPRAQQARRVSG